MFHSFSIICLLYNLSKRLRIVFFTANILSYINVCNLLLSFHCMLLIYNFIVYVGWRVRRRLIEKQGMTPKGCSAGAGTSDE